MTLCLIFPSAWFILTCGHLRPGLGRRHAFSALGEPSVQLSSEGIPQSRLAEQGSVASYYDENGQKSSSASSRSLPLKRYAVALYGGMSLKADKFPFGIDVNGRIQEKVKKTIAKDDLMINASVPAALYKKNLLPQGQYDTFIHSWSPDFEEVLLKLYQPQAWSFEREQNYKGDIDETVEKMSAKSNTPFGSEWYFCSAQVAMALSISKVLDLVRKFEDTSGHRYSAILVARPDVLLSEPLHLDSGLSNNTGSEQETNNTNIIWNTKGNHKEGDYHYRMSSRNARIFQRIYADIPKLSTCIAHKGWVKEFCALHDLRLRGDIGGGIWESTEVVYRKATPDFWRRVAASLNDTSLNPTEPPSSSASSMPHG